MTALNEFLSPMQISLNDLLLDPNNPRFAELGGPNEPVPETRISEERVQHDALDRMKNARFDVVELRDTIKTIGYLPVDRIVVRKWCNPIYPNVIKYVVVEGNRRVAALKWLIELHETGRETFNKDQLTNFMDIPALLLDEENAPDFTNLVLPGLRHVSGIKEWGPYQKARAVFVLRESGQTPKEVAQSLGLATQSANQLWRSYLALEQMKADEEFGEFVQPSMYSYFEEIIKRPNVRNWLGWNDAEGKFVNEDRLRELYGWIIGELVDDGNDENRADPKLPEAKSIRELSRFIDDDGALSIFRSANGSLLRALSSYESEHQPAWQITLTSTRITLASLSPDTLRSMTPEDVTTLNDLATRIQQVLRDRESLTQN